jgi:bacterioferritin-associated ferredoxin
MAVSQSEVQAAIEGGATTREAVTRACRAGGDCGACHGMIASMIEDHLEDGAPSLARCPEARESGDRLIPDSALIRTVA